jgi:cytochrome oxidase Cu insertion factor (SCO1/SenC/PrrC family)
MSDSHREQGIALGGVGALLVITAAWWALALWPTGETPEWLARTRYVCFGIGESGLPDAGGWIGLVGGPLGMFAILAAGWHRGMFALVRRARRSAPLAAVLGGLTVCALLLPAGAVLRVRQVAARQAIAQLGVPQPPPDFRRFDRTAPPLALLAHDGSTVDLAAMRGRPVLVTFAYAHCETVCPLVVRDVLAARALLHAERVPADALPALLIVTLDPWRDTPSRLAPMAAAWSVRGPDAWVLGGPIDAVEAALDAWHVPRSRDLVTGEVTHPSLVYVVDREGRIAFAASGGAEVLADLVRRL